MTAIFDWRQRLGFTQREAAEALGVSLPTLQTWEREKNWKGEFLEAPKTALLAAAAIENNLTQITPSQNS